MPNTTEERNILNRQIDRARSMDTHMLTCRVGGDRHYWVLCQPDFAPAAGLAIVHQCSQCDTIKRVTVSPRYGEVLSSSYEYPAGYQIPRDEHAAHGERMLSSNAVRIALWARERPMAALRRRQSEE